MKMTVAKAWKSAQALQTLEKVSMPSVMAYKVAKVIESFFPYLARVGAAQNAALKKYGTPNPDNLGMYSVENVSAFEAEMESVMAVEEELPDFDKIDVGSIKNEKLPPSVFVDLGWLFFLDDGWK